jgi:phosphomannomutase
MSNSRRLFGTDGIRGKANTDPMTAETALRLGQAAGLMFTRGSHRHKVVIGKDTRLSGYMIEPALTAGFTGAGMDVTLVGPLPTPAIAMLTRSMRCDLGVMISASHNPYEDNGIKLFGPDGFKLSDETEAARPFSGARPRRPAGGRGGTLHRGSQGQLSPRTSASGSQNRGRLCQWRSLSRRADGALGTGRNRYSYRRHTGWVQYQ